MPTLDDSVLDFVAEFTAIKRQRLTSGATLFGDLGVDGADGWELIEAFGQKFQVDLSEFKADRHFGPETSPSPLILFLWPWRLISEPFRKTQTPEERAGLKAIRISDMVAAAREKKWML